MSRTFSFTNFKQIDWIYTISVFLCVLHASVVKKIPPLNQIHIAYNFTFPVNIKH